MLFNGIKLKAIKRDMYDAKVIALKLFYLMKLLSWRAELYAENGILRPKNTFLKWSNIDVSR